MQRSRRIPSSVRASGRSRASVESRTRADAFRGGFLAAVNLAKSWLEDMPADGLIEHLEAELSEYDKWKR